MLYSGTDPESDITEYTLVYEEKPLHPDLRRRVVALLLLHSLLHNTQRLQPSLFFTFVTGPRRSLSLKLSDTRGYEPQIRAHLGTTAYFEKTATLLGQLGREREGQSCSVPPRASSESKHPPSVV